LLIRSIGGTLSALLLSVPAGAKGIDLIMGSFPRSPKPEWLIVKNKSFHGCSRI
jgi:hypothetical protein